MVQLLRSHLQATTADIIFVSVGCACLVQRWVGSLSLQVVGFTHLLLQQVQPQNEDYGWHHG